MDATFSARTTYNTKEICVSGLAIAMHVVCSGFGGNVQEGLDTPLDIIWIGYPTLTSDAMEKVKNCDLTEVSCFYFHDNLYL